MDDWWEQASPEMAANRFLDELGETNAAVTQGIAPPGDEETTFEKVSDIILGLAFLGTTIVAAKRMAMSRSQGGPETTVVTAFYSLILVTSVVRAVWFLIPDSVMNPSYTPTAVMAFDPNYPSWPGEFISQILTSAGSLSLFSIFILILVYWADILKKYFYPGARRSKPMVTFIALVILLVLIEVVNCILFLTKVYSSEGMILVNAILLSTVSIICVCEITIFSHRFRTVLKTLGAINQVSTESQVKRIVWITLTGNLFFFTRAFLETIFAFMLVIYWSRTGTVAEVFSHSLWDSYMLLKHWSEVAILCLMLYILQSRFTTNAGAPAGSSTVGGRTGYDRVPDAEQGGPVKAVVV
mmetsp:Transcript_6136/g.8030  ORF Transcript_6136/g.8030 Transcript_6136/m.8030 type:complete len:355 (+) Transcript_6136:31-1095(+)